MAFLVKCGDSAALTVLDAASNIGRGFWAVDGQFRSYSGPEVRLEEICCYGTPLALRSPRTPFVDREQVPDEQTYEALP